MSELRNVEEIKARLAEIEAEIKGTKADKAIADEKKVKIYNVAFWEHMHTGMPSNALKEGGDGAGGYLVPDEFDDRLVQALKEKNIMRQLGTTMTTERDLKIPVALSNGEADWIEEGNRHLGSVLQELKRDRQHIRQEFRNLQVNQLLLLIRLVKNQSILQFIIRGI